MYSIPAHTMKVQTLWTFHAGEWRKFYYHCTGTPSKRKQPSPEMRESLFLEQEGQCAFCKTGLRTDPADFDCDHIIPVRCGGPTCMPNLHLLCIRCHRAKSARERSRPNEDQAIETPNITPKSISEIVGQSVDGAVHIAGEGVTGTGYSTEFRIHAGMTSAQIRMAVKMGMAAEKIKIYENKIASGVAEEEKKRCEKRIEEERKWAKEVDAPKDPAAKARKKRKKIEMWGTMCDSAPRVEGTDPVVSDDFKPRKNRVVKSLLSMLAGA